MRAFREYWDQREKEMRPNVSHYHSAQSGWKAALEWVKNKGYCDGMGFYCSYLDDIEEELEED